MKNAVEMIEALHYKLHMFGVPIEGPTHVYCDNGSVCKNGPRPTSTLTKRHHSIAYHRTREAVAAEMIRVTKEGTLTNLSDLFTKIMSDLHIETGVVDFYPKEGLLPKEGTHSYRVKGTQ